MTLTTTTTTMKMLIQNHRCANCNNFNRSSHTVYSVLARGSTWYGKPIWNTNYCDKQWKI